MASSAIVMAAMAPAQVHAQASGPISVPAMPMNEALQQIQTQSGVPVHYDPDAARGLVSVPVRGARSAEAAVRDAIGRQALAVESQPDGSLLVTQDIVVVAQRDEAETNTLVRQASTSSRNGQSLREQARNNQVISSKVIADQQSLRLNDVLRNAGAVTVNPAMIQGGATYTVRGFTSYGLTNGLPGPGAGGVQVGATQPLANVERIEVLKGADALLAGADELGGSVNIVTKKPFAEALLTGTADTGSFGLTRLTIDANNAISDDKTLSGRIIATVSTMDRNYGGYRGDEEYLFAPSVRYKNGGTDIVASLMTSAQRFGASAFTLFDPASRELLDVADGKPVFARRQGADLDQTQYFVDASRRVAEWLTLVVRAQHQDVDMTTFSYGIFQVIDGDGNAVTSNSRNRQFGNTDAIDGFARLRFSTFGVKHRFNIGYTYVDAATTSLGAGAAETFVANFRTGAGVLPFAAVDTEFFSQTAIQRGVYAQDLIEFWKLHLSAGARYNKYDVTTRFPGSAASEQKADAVTPNFGVVFDVMPHLSLFGTLSRGYSPNFLRNAAGNRLPDIRTRNAEAGVKLDLFGDKVAVNASWFQLRQSNLTVGDPANPGFSRAVPGQQGEGLDLNASGEIVRDWSIQASFTRTKYRYLTASDFGTIVVGQPRDQYSLYTSYLRPLGSGVSAGLGAGLFGRSSAAADSLGTFHVPASRQVDLNGMLKVAGFDVNVGIRNVFDRRNYGASFFPTYVPISEPRNWRLTVSRRFF